MSYYEQELDWRYKIIVVQIIEHMHVFTGFQHWSTVRPPMLVKNTQHNDYLFVKFGNILKIKSAALYIGKGNIQSYAKQTTEIQSNLKGTIRFAPYKESLPYIGIATDKSSNKQQGNMPKLSPVEGVMTTGKEGMIKEYNG